MRKITHCYHREALDFFPSFLVEDVIEMEHPKEDVPATAPGIGHFIPFLCWYGIGIMLRESDEVRGSRIPFIRSKIQHVGQDEEVAERQEIEKGIKVGYLGNMSKVEY